MILEFLKWHYIIGLKNAAKFWLNFTKLAFHLFSVNLLLKTLFSPWRRIEIKKTRTGFSLENFLHELTFNLISRTIGFIVRSMIVFWGLLIGIIFFIIGMIIFFVWPFLFPLTFFIFLLNRDPSKTDEELIRRKAKKFVLSRLNLKNLEELKTVLPEDVKAVVAWYKQDRLIKEKNSAFWEKENLYKLPSFGYELAYGYTLELDKYSEDLSFPPSFSHQLVGRIKEIKQIEAVLGKTVGSNLYLIGEPGCGRKTILLGLAKAIKEKKVNPNLFYKRILAINMNLILGTSGLTSQGKVKFEELLNEAEKAGNIILVIDHIDKYVNSENGYDLTPIITNFASSKRIQIIGVTTPSDFENYLYPNTQLSKYFEKINVFPPERNEALEIIEQILPNFEKGKKVFFTYQAIKEIIEKSDQLISNIPFPEKAIDLIDQIVSLQPKKKEIITKEKIDQLISEKLRIPLGSLSENEAEKLRNLSNLLKNRLIGQDLAREGMIKALQRSRVGISSTKRAMGTFLFLGPTGVGKTETAKALAEAYFGSEKKIVRFDMVQEFNFNLFYQLTRESPFGILLLDEFEKAKGETLNFFLPIFDEGYIKDNNGMIISFKNMIIICTSNAGSEFIREKLKKNASFDYQNFQTQITEHILEKGIFSPELINRFDSVVIYKPLELKEVEQIARLQLTKLTNDLKQKQLFLTIDEKIYPLLSIQGFSEEFGCRPLKRLIADKIESLLAQKILNKQINNGDKLFLTVDVDGKEFTIIKENPNI